LLKQINKQQPDLLEMTPIVPYSLPSLDALVSLVLWLAWNSVMHT
jgi:hypothetical protein